MTSPLIWLHEDCLNPHSPALQAYPKAPRVFVFAEDPRASLKRIVFQYECLLEIPGVEIRRGEVVTELVQAAREHNCQRLVTMSSVAPQWAAICAILRDDQQLSVEVFAPEPFVDNAAGEAERFDLRRFSRYWHPIKARALSLNPPFAG